MNLPSSAHLHCHSPLRIGWDLALLLLVLAAPIRVVAEIAPLVVLHTNDLHDRVRVTPRGGLPYVSGYVQKVRGEAPRVLMVDAGDASEKGDLVALKTRSLITFEAMRRIGYDGVAIGNHDIDPVGVEGMRRKERALGQPVLCLNMVNANSVPLFQGSRVVNAGEMKVGLIGMTVPRTSEPGGLDSEASGLALAREATRLQPEVSLVIAICHESVAMCAQWARIAPDVDVFVSGHSHEILVEPLVVPETGALIVQAGHNARYVGRLELMVDTKTKNVVSHAGQLVEMRPENVPIDTGMAEWVRERERQLVPEAAEPVFDNPAELDGFSVARLAAEGMRRATGADIAFCHPAAILRESLPKGPVDVNAVYLTGGIKADETLLVELTGAEIAAYFNALITVNREMPEWVGFRVVRTQMPNRGERWETDLDADRCYRVVMARAEWLNRFLRLTAPDAAIDPRRPLVSRAFAVKQLDVNFTDATVVYLRHIVEQGDSVHERALVLAEAREGPVARQ